MKILIVADDDDKRVQITKFASEEIHSNYVEAKSLQSAVKCVIQEHFDLILLDMTMTTFDISKGHQGGRPQSYAGKELLLQMVRRGINFPVIVITQFDVFEPKGEKITLEQLDRDLLEQFPEIYLGAVHFNVKYDDWREKVKQIINYNKLKNV